MITRYSNYQLYGPVASPVTAVKMWIWPIRLLSCVFTSDSSLRLGILCFIFFYGINNIKTPVISDSRFQFLYSMYFTHGCDTDNSCFMSLLKIKQIGVIHAAKYFLIILPLSVFAHPIALFHHSAVQ